MSGVCCEKTELTVWWAFFGIYELGLTLSLFTFQHSRRSRLGDRRRHGALAQAERGTVSALTETAARGNARQTPAPSIERMVGV